ncbi:Uncharacterised protein [Candidatus Anstonella stagnisolia]|nr:Uncharacterised protein [Candidatus Anstonella stagnisolia]
MYKPIAIPVKKGTLLVTLKGVEDPSELEPRHVKLLFSLAKQRVGQIDKLQKADRSQMKRPRANLDALAIERGEFEAQMKRFAPFNATRRDWLAERAAELLLVEKPAQPQKPEQKGLELTTEEQRLASLQEKLALLDAEIDALPNRDNGNGEKFLKLLAQKKAVERDIEKAKYYVRLRSGSIQGTFSIDEKRAQIKELDRDIESLTIKICDLTEIKESKSRNWTSVDEQALQNMNSMRAGARVKLKKVWDTAPRKIFSNFVDDGLRMDLTHGSVTIGEWSEHSFA